MSALKNVSSYISLLAIGLLTAVSAQAQSVDYSRPKPQFPNLIAPYTSHEVPQPEFGNSPRVDEIVKDGKIMLSLNDAIALALENNLDLAIARYNLQIADTDILLTKSGGATRGVATGLISGTPGGGVGGLGSGAPGAGAGGTSGGAGGAGTGASGLVQSTLGVGSAIDSYDPTITGTLSIEHALYPSQNVAVNGTLGALSQNTGLGNFNVSKYFSTGTSLSVEVDNSRQTTNSPEVPFTPALSGFMRVGFSQHLLQGFGAGPNRRFIRIAQNNREISDVAFRNQVIATVTQIENIYWDLVSATSDVKVKQRALALAQKTLEDDRKQVELQSMAPIEVTNAENEVEVRNQDLTVAQTTLELQQLLIKNAVTRNLSEGNIGDAEVIPTDVPDVPPQEPVLPIQDLISEAISGRPELIQARIDLTNREISRKSARNALLPELDLVGFYGGSSLTGVENPALLTAGYPQFAPSGFGDALNNSFNNSAPDYAVALRLTIPLRNRAAQADQVRSELEYRQAQLHMKQLQNQIGIEVRNAQFALQQYRARLDAAQKARDLAQKTFEIEQKKFDLGASSSLLVLQSGNSLAVAESNLVTATTVYEKARVELDYATGRTLLHNGIEIADAETGYVHKMPHVAGVVTKPE